MLRRFLLALFLVCASASAWAQNTPDQNTAAINAVPWGNTTHQVTGYTIQTLLNDINGTFNLYAHLGGATFTGPVIAPALTTTGNFRDQAAVDVALVCDGATDVGATLNTALSTYAGYVVRIPNSASDCTTSVPILVPANTILSGSGASVLSGSIGKPGMGPVVKLNGNGAQVRDLKIKGSGAGTTLAGGISGGATSLTVASATGWPTVGPFKATIFADGANSTETVNVSSVSGTTWAIAATSGAHGNNALVQPPRGDVGVLAAATFSNAKVLNTEVSNAGDNGIETNGNDTEIASNYVHDNFTNGIYHVGQTGSHVIAYRARIHDNRLDNNSVFSTTCTTTASPSCWDGIDLDPLTADGIVANNYVGENDIILFETDAAWATTSTGHQVIGNKIFNSVAGCLTAAGFVDNFKFIGNQCINIAGSAVTINGPATNGQVENNAIDGSTKQCIYEYPVASGTFAGIGDKIAFTNNVCTNTDTGAVGSAIQISTGATNTTLDGNQVLGTNGGVYAIDVNVAAASTYLRNNWPLVIGTTNFISMSGSQPTGPQPGAGAGSLVGGLPTSSNLNAAGTYSFNWGQGSAATGASSQALGFVNTADQTFSSAMGGNAWTQNRYGGHVFASGDFTTNGDAQFGVYTLRGKATTAAGTVTIRSTADQNAANSANCVNLTSNLKYMNTTHQLVIVDSTTAARVSFSLTNAGIYRGANAAATVVDGTGFPSWVRGSSNGSSTGGTAASAWAAPTMTADTTNGCINVSWVSPSETADTFYVVDSIQTTEH